MSDLIMTISDDEEEGLQPRVAGRKRALVAGEEGGAASESGSDSDGSEDDDRHDDSDSDGDEDEADAGKGADENADEDDEDDESFKFGDESFHFEASDSDSDDEVVHAWDLSDARAAAVQDTRGTNLRAKIDATLRRKGPTVHDLPVEDTAAAEAQAVEDAAAVERPVSDKARKKQQAKALKALAASARRGGGSSEAPEKAVVTQKPNVQHSHKGWNELALSRPLLRAVKDLGFANPTPIQAEAIPLALQGESPTGTSPFPSRWLVLIC